MTGQRCGETVRPACLQCAISPEAGPWAAALIVDAQEKVVRLNVAGCVAGLTGDLSHQGCGPRYLAQLRCQEEACAACPSSQGRSECFAAVERGVCALRYELAACAAPVLSQCSQGSSDVEVAFNLIKVFCGPP